ncbi:MAG: response regulator [Acidobacteriota bacterium]
MSKRKLLLADDSITIQKVVNLTFADEGIEVVAVGDGDAAMQKFVEIKPDLVMVDVNMPGMDGYKICELIKQDEETKHIPVILLVGSFEPFDEDEAHRVGADDYLTKPFQSIRQLVNKVSLLLDNNAKESSGNGSVSENERAKLEDETLEQPIVGSFGDFGMDDDMIQTDQIGSLPVDEARKFESNSASEKPFFELPQMTLKKPYEFDTETSVKEEDVSKTQPLSTAEFNKITSEPANENAEKASDFAVKPSFSKRYIIEEPKVPKKEPSENQIFSDENQFAPVEETPETYSTSRQTELLNFDDFNLLELPMFEDEEFSSGVEQEVTNDFEGQLFGQMPETSEILHEATSEKSKETNEILEETSAPIPESVEVSQISSENEIETREPIAQAISFSPELIEAIASRVAEKISERAVREIASEVTPQMVELIIKRMAKEETEE